MDSSSSQVTIKYDRIHLDSGHLQSLTSIQHIPTCLETKSPVITILQKDTWGDEILQMSSWSGSIFTGGEPLRYPFRVGAKWRREIIGGNYAEVVNKAKVTVIIIYNRVSSGVNGTEKGTLSDISTIYHYEYEFTESDVFVGIRVFFHEGIGCGKLYTTKDFDCMLLQVEGLDEVTVGELRMTTTTLQTGDVSRERASGQGTR